MRGRSPAGRGRRPLVVLGHLFLIGAGTVLGITVVMTLAVYFRRPEGRTARRPALLG